MVSLPSLTRPAVACRVAHYRDYLKRTLSGFALHPNVFGHVVVGLGCEVNQPSQLIEFEQLMGKESPPPRMLIVQESGGIASTVARGIEAVEQLLPLANEHVAPRSQRRRSFSGLIVVGATEVVE